MKESRVPLVLALAIFLFLGGCGNNLTPWLESQGVVLDGEWSLDPIALEAYDIFLAGESHGVAQNYALQFDLTVGFHRQGVRYNLAEIGYSQGQLINRYLESGDREILDTIFADLKGTAAWSREGYEFFKRLYQYNQQFPGDQRILMVGIDIEHQPTTAVRYLRLLAQEAGEAPATLSGVRLLTNPPEGELSLLVTGLLQDLAEHNLQYRLWLGDSFFSFALTVGNLQSALDSYADERKDFNRIREEAIYANFLAVYSHLPKGKYFGQWGMEHVYQRLSATYMAEQPRLAMLINDEFDSPVRGRVLSMAIIYGPDSRSMSWGQEYGIGKVHDHFKDIKVLARAAGEQVTLFPLEGEFSPFRNELRIIRHPLQGGVTTDYFQYVIVIPQGTPATPLE